MSELGKLTAADLERFAAAAPVAIDPATGEQWERGCIPVGEQHHWLVSVAGTARESWRLDADGIFHVLKALCSNGTLERDPTRRPWADADLQRIATDIGAKPCGTPSFEVVAPPATIMRGADVAIAGPTVRWWGPRGFFPREELVMLFGPKASGKSTVGSWLATMVTRRGSSFLHVGVEEPYQRFLARAVLGGADRSKVLGWKGSLRLPQDVDELVEVILREQVGMVYFDSVYSCFATDTKMLESTRARHCLEPMAAACQAHGFTAVAQFHDRRADGDYMGSTEMINVARVILRLSRRQGEASRLHVRTTNFTHPEHALRFDAVDMPVVDPETGEVQLEEQEDGTDAPLILKIVSAVEKVAESAEGVNSSDVEAPKKITKENVIDAC